MADKDRNKHNELQVEYFEQRAKVFEQQIPNDIQMRTARIVETAGVDETTKLLDVGTGVGVLIRHFLNAGARQQNVVGCDLTQAMLDLAAQRYPEVYFWRGDVMEFSFSSLPANFPLHIDSFDRVFFNACFANMHDRHAVLVHSSKLLSENGKIIISHPAPKFVTSLHQTDPQIVPHLLPTQSEAEAWSSDMGLELVHFESTELLYLTIFRRLKCS